MMAAPPTTSHADFDSIPDPDSIQPKLPPAQQNVDPKLQAGGGTPASTAGSLIVAVDAFKPVMATHVDVLYNQLQQRYDLTKKEGFAEWLEREQGVDPQLIASARLSSREYTVQNFRRALRLEPFGNAQAPLPNLDLSYPISHYFISSSHNTYLTGNQLSSDSSANGYKNVLLRGCRCVEIDVWDGVTPDSSDAEDGADVPTTGKMKGLKSLLREKLRKVKSGESTSPEATSPSSEEGRPISPRRTASRESRAEPRVLHGYTATKEVPFRAVCETIRDYAFVTSQLPVIVSLEVHTSLEQQEVMVDIMEECWGGMLLDLPQNPTDDLPLPLLKDLIGKILIKVKYTSPKPPAADPQPRQLTKASIESETMSTSSSSSSSSSESEDGGETRRKPEPKRKIHDALSRLGVYTRSYHFKNLDQPEAKIPTHIFSLSETRLIEVHSQRPTDLFKHNKDFLMRAYPKGLRVSSSNLDPSFFWRKGVQIVALNWQRWDSGTMLNEAMFSGSDGWILKPQGYLGSAAPDHQRHEPRYVDLAELNVEFLAGQDIPMPPGEDDPATFRPYVKVELHVETIWDRQSSDSIQVSPRPKDTEYKARTKTARGTDADFGAEIVQFSNVRGICEELCFIRFKVMDDDRLRDDLASWSCIRLDRFQPGLRVIHLFDANGVASKGIILVRISKRYGSTSQSGVNEVGEKLRKLATI